MAFYYFCIWIIHTWAGICRQKAPDSRKRMTKPTTLPITELGTARPPTKTEATVLGLKRSRTSRSAALVLITARMIFMDPDVEPAHPPRNINVTSSMRENSGQVSKFALTKPVVVRTETTWNNESSIGQSCAPSPATNRFDAINTVTARMTIT